MRITVIVATYNSLIGSFLKPCLESVFAQSVIDQMEVLVVDGGSTDGTVEFSKSVGAKVVFNSARTEFGFGGAKNRGLKLVSTELVSFVDADNMLIEKDYYASMMAPYETQPSIVATVPMPFVPSESSVSRVCRFYCLRERDYWVGQPDATPPTSGYRLIRPTSFVVSNGAVLPRAALLNLGGWDYDTEVGRKLLQDPSSLVALVFSAHRFHHEMRSLLEVRRKMSRRVNNQVVNASAKPAVGREVAERIRRPYRYLSERLVEPMRAFANSGDITYLVSLPVFLVESGVMMTNLKGLVSASHARGT